MRRGIWLSLILASAQPSSPADRCRVDAFAALPAAIATVTSAEVVDSSCRIHATTKPTRESLITFEVWLPTAWNGKVVLMLHGGTYGAVPVFDFEFKDAIASSAGGISKTGGIGSAKVIQICEVDHRSPDAQIATSCGG